jgi:hypothetical protein
MMEDEYGGAVQRRLTSDPDIPLIRHPYAGHLP